MTDEVFSVTTHICLILTVSMAPAEPARHAKYQSFQEYTATHKTDEQKKEEVGAVQKSATCMTCFRRLKMVMCECQNEV